ncbi:uncharacterized protein PG998_011178 [Apiospora kogelbergensis]|uniref:uncharacterized protein n=1 Tax=Apiospora kogelbergensis TaxID=1337665 RepID=UPI0031314AEB
MTDPANATSPTHELLPSSPGIPTTAEHEQDAPQPSPPFAPIYTLVTNTSTRSTHHPHVHYIFNDDDPDILSQALAHQHERNVDESTSDPQSHGRTVLLDVEPDADGGYKVSWASSLSPSWAVVDAQLSRIAPPSEAAGADTSGSADNPQKSDRLMLRIDGIEAASAGTESELRLSNRSGQGSGSGSSLGSSQRDRDNESYSTLVDEFERRMVMLRKMVDSSEERRQKVEAEAAAESVPAMQPEFSVTESA